MSEKSLNDLSLSELQVLAATLPERMLEATRDGAGVEVFAQLEQERNALPALLYHAEQKELREELLEQRAALVDEKAELRAEGVTAVELAQAVRDAMKRAEQHQRTVGLASNRVMATKERIRQIEDRMAELSELQANFARQQVAPVQRNMLRNRVPGPVRWPA